MIVMTLIRSESIDQPPVKEIVIAYLSSEITVRIAVEAYDINVDSARHSQVS